MQCANLHVICKSQSEFSRLNVVDCAQTRPDQDEVIQEHDRAAKSFKQTIAANCHARANQHWSTKNGAVILRRSSASRLCSRTTMTWALFFSTRNSFQVSDIIDNDNDNVYYCHIDYAYDDKPECCADMSLFI